jgi:3-dehydrosphinganine reductase
MNITKLVKKQPFQKKLAIFCGGSKGIGKETAKLFVQMGGSVCLIARNEDILKLSKAECTKLANLEDQFVETISCDTSDMDKLKPLLDDFISRHYIPDFLINTIGYAIPKNFETYVLDDFRKNMDVNYFGTLIPILILLPHFLKAQKGHIVNTSSIAGFLGIFGYGTYSPTKFAIAGLTEVLRNEFKPQNIHCSLLFPPDTDTDAYKRENLTRPPECEAVSSTGKIMQPQKVAEALIKGILKKKFNITPGGSRFVWNVKRLVPKLTYAFIDNDEKNAQKKKLSNI